MQRLRILSILLLGVFLFFAACRTKSNDLDAEGDGSLGFCSVGKGDLAQRELKAPSILSAEDVSVSSQVFLHFFRFARSSNS